VSLNGISLPCEEEEEEEENHALPSATMHHSNLN